MKDCTYKFTKEDIEKGRGSLFLSYVLFLFIIPCFCKKNSPYARFHINQGMCLIIFEIGLSIIQFVFRQLLVNLLPIPVMVVLNFIIAVLWILVLSFAVKGIMNVNSGLAIKLPIVGRFNLVDNN